MGLFDNFEKEFDKGLKNIGSDINAYIQSRVVDPVVKIGEKQKGNLSAVEIASGQKGSTGPTNNIIENGMSDDSKDMLTIFVMISVVAVILINVLPKKR